MKKIKRILKSVTAIYCAIAVSWTGIAYLKNPLAGIIVFVIFVLIFAALAALSRLTQ